MYWRLVLAIVALLPYSVFANMDGQVEITPVQMAQHYVNQFSAVSALVTVIGFVVGVTFMVRSWYLLPKLADKNERQNTTAFDLMLYFAFGTMMVYMVASHVVWHETLFASTIDIQDSPFVYGFSSQSVSSDSHEASAQMLRVFFEMIGSCAFFYGLLLGPTISRTHPKHREGGLGKVLGFSISGTLAMFPVTTLTIFSEFIPFLKVFLDKIA